jgi:uncharacterized membrane protein YgaE (UPF0421/DUF939 family)
MAGAATLAWWLCTLLGAPRPIFAALIPLVALSSDPVNAVNDALARIAGVFAGIGIATGLIALGLPLLALVGLGIFFGALVGTVLSIGDRTNVEPAISALFLIGFASTGILQSGVTRLWETAVGAGVSILVAALVWPPDPAHELSVRLERLRRELALDLAAVAEDLATHDGAVAARLDELRQRSRDAMRDVYELDRLRRSLRWSPLRRRDTERVQDLERRIALAARLYRHARAIARDVIDLDPQAPELAAATRELIEASDLALRGEPYWQVLDGADAMLAVEETGPALIVREQLRQMVADLRTLA